MVGFLPRPRAAGVNMIEELPLTAANRIVLARAFAVSPDYRRQRVATAPASRLVGWCLGRGIEAHWDAANLESRRVADLPAGDYRAYDLLPDQA